MLPPSLTLRALHDPRRHELLEVLSQQTKVAHPCELSSDRRVLASGVALEERGDVGSGLDLWPCQSTIGGGRRRRATPTRIAA